MYEPLDYQLFTTSELCRIIADILEVLNERVKDPQERENITAVMLAGALARGAEPYWMQDVRIAQKAISAQRAAIKRSAPDQSN